MNTRPPNFSRNYPLGGERTGKAWGLMWQQLSTTEWREGLLLAGQLAWRAEVLPATMQKLLQQARVAGILEVELRQMPGRKRLTAHYRVTKRGVRRQPGKMKGRLKAFLYGGSHYDDE